MYYSKYFEGSVTADTESHTSYYPLLVEKSPSENLIASFSANTTLRNKVRVIGEAIASTLRDCGLDAKYDIDTCYLYFDYENSDIGMFIAPYGSQIAAYISYAVDGSDYVHKTTSASSIGGIFYTGLQYVFSGNGSGDDYKFCVTVRGDTKSMFAVYLGPFTNPTALTHTLCNICFGKDKRDDSEIIGVYIGYGGPTGVNLIARATLLPLTDVNSSSSYKGFQSKLTIVDNWITLIEQYLPTMPFIAFDDIYIDPGFGALGQFYEIDGDIYYCYTPCIVKCTTEVTPTPANIEENNNG